MRLVSIIMPCRNEERYISRCLDSIIANDYQKDFLEVLVVDGMSEDRTREIAGAYVDRYPFMRLLDNPQRVQTFATNIGIRKAKGDVVVRMDAHAEYPKNYVSRCVHRLEESSADCVGGQITTRPGSDGVIAGAIALALSHPFGVGNAYFRIGVDELKEVDTVPFGCYKKEVFERVGLFNENLNRTDDIEFNLRLKRAGGKILLAPDIRSVYYSRPDLPSLVKQNFGNGLCVLYSLAFVKMPFSVRHLVPLFFVLSLLGSFLLLFIDRPFLYLFALIAGLYLAVDVFVSLKLSLKKGMKYFPSLIVSFLSLHISYGLGSLWGLVKLVAKSFKL
jgi:cellulose synthase/poly-beta-1,6-N-acetylglucosamine synthase-like glycosyltransferase